MHPQYLQYSYTVFNSAGRYKNDFTLNLLSRNNKWKESTCHLKKILKERSDLDQYCPFQYFCYLSTILTNPTIFPDSHQIELYEYFFIESPILSSSKSYVGQKLEYISNVTKVIYGIIFLSIHKNASADPTCGFGYNIQQFNGATWRHRW